MLKAYHRHIYFFSLSLLAVSLPLSVFLLSVAQISLLVNWLLENNFREKWKIALENKSIFAFIIIYSVHLVGMTYSTDWKYGLHDLQIKLPMLILPVIIGTSRQLSHNRFKQVLLVFCGAVLVSTLISSGKLFNWWGSPVMDVRDISIFISHIRLALMVNLAIFVLFWFIAGTDNNSFKVASFIAIAWLILFLVILKSLTGLIIFLALCLFFSVRWGMKTNNTLAKWFITVGISFLILFSATYLTHSIGRFYKIEKIIPTDLEKVTANGNFYMHDTMSKDIENSSYTWLYVCEKELEPVWNKKSRLDYRGTDLKGQELRYTLIRYLTSKGLRKDSAGLNSLSDEDIRNIELGMANYIYSWKFSLYPRIYQLLWEVHQFRNGGNPSGHSFTQRLEYMQTAFDIIRNHFWMGVGTGNVAAAFEKQYIENNSKLDLKWRLRAHNQFVTFFLAFGVFGFIVVAAALVYPVFKEKAWKNYLMLLFILIAFLSFLNEDTLETHAGISFFAFFYAFFLYQKNELS